MDAQHQLILAILSEARDQGVAPLLKTVLIKYLYLLDVYVAEETHGTPISGCAWRFLHYGPFSPAVAQAIDDLVRQGIVSADRRETQGGDKEFVLYDLAEYTRKSNLRDLGVSGAIQLRIQADMKRYSRDLPRLLDYVYFRTAPMADATPGQVLDFSGCVKMHSEDFRAVEMRRLRPKAIKNVRIRLRELIRERAEREMAQQGPFDDVYYSAIEVLNGEPAETGLTGKAKIKV